MSALVLPPWVISIRAKKGGGGFEVALGAGAGVVVEGFSTEESAGRFVAAYFGALCAAQRRSDSDKLDAMVRRLVSTEPSS